MVKISKTYIPKESEKYMCEKHKIYFKNKLLEWKKDLIRTNNEALYNGSIDFAGDTIPKNQYPDNEDANDLYLN